MKHSLLLLAVLVVAVAGCDDEPAGNNGNNQNNLNNANNLNNTTEPEFSSVCGMWAEGTQEFDDGATRDYYNRGAKLPWRNFMGDWHDAEGTGQGEVPFATAPVSDTNDLEVIEWDVTGLVQAFVDETHANKGFFLRPVSSGGPFDFYSREYDEVRDRPQLIVVTTDGTTTLYPHADTYLAESTYQGFGDEPRLRLSQSSPILIRFDLSQWSPEQIIDSATLIMTKYDDYGGETTQVGVFRSSHGLEQPPSDPLPGIAGEYTLDQNILEHPDVLLFTDFEDPAWGEAWTSGSDSDMIEVVTEDDSRGFEPLKGSALRVKVAAGDNYGMSLIYKFLEETGEEPEEIYFRYYLRFADDWDPTFGGKLPGVSGTYGIAGWGGRPVDGTNGWSARGTYEVPVVDDPTNPYADHIAIGNYVYHADMEGQYGDVFFYLNDCRGILARNRWYSVEQYVRMNTPGENDGVIRTWVDGRLAHESTTWRFRDIDTLKVEQIWMNVYHGGTDVPPTDIHLYMDNIVIARSYIGPLAQ